MEARRRLIVAATLLACLPAAIARADEPSPARPRPPSPAQPASFQQAEVPRPLGLQLPADLPGANAPGISLPGYDPLDRRPRMEAINRLFPPLQPLPPAVVLTPGPNDRPWTLGELENLALAMSPVIRQAEADIVSARGYAIKVGTPPNPTVGYEGDTIGSGGTPNYHGAFFNNWVKTAGKLQLAQAAATIDVRNAELALRKARMALIAQVQARYYAVLVAEESMRTSEALANFTDQAYAVQIEQLRGGEATGYEPMQLRVLAIQARATVVQARNRYFSAWKQLATIVNRPDLPPTRLAGNPNVAIPLLRYEPLKDVVWRLHPDILAARNSEEKARIRLRLQEVMPVPDLSLYFALQKDYTFNSAGQSFNTQIGLPLPLFDRNVGGITQAQGELASALQLATRTRNELSAQLADAFERYENNRAVLDYYRGHVLFDQFRAYRGAYGRHQQEPERVGFSDVVVAQQTYAAAINSYLAALASQWQAVTDLLNTVQVEDLLDLEQLVNQPATMPEVVSPVRPPEAAPN